MIDATALWLLGLLAVACIARIHVERRQEDREAEEQRNRMFKGRIA